MNFKYLEDFLEELVTVQGIPGVDCIVQKGHETIFRHHAGYADREARIPMCGQELFNLYSATKPITCTAILQLYEQGKLLLTDPLYKYLPEFQDMTVRQINSGGVETFTPAQNAITIGHLLSMMAGLDYDLNSPAIKEVCRQTNGEVPTREVIRALAGQPLHYEPGTRWFYSLAHDVLGAVVEIVSKEPFGVYLKKHIFDVLGMERTGFSRSPEVLEQMMAQYMRNPESGEIERISLDNEYVFGTKYESGGAGLVSCLDDYARFTAALATGGTSSDGKRILSPATIDLMRTNHLSSSQMSDYSYPELVGYGYGFGVRTMIDKVTGGANSPIGEFGWSGAGGIYFLMDVEREISLFYTQQVREVGASYIHPYVHPRLRNILYACL